MTRIEYAVKTKHGSTIYTAEDMSLAVRQADAKGQFTDGLAVVLVETVVHETEVYRPASLPQ